MFTLNFSSRQPIYEQLYNNVVQLVSIGVLTPNEQLPPMRNLAAELGVNPNTVSKAYQALEKDGYIYTLVGRGSFVSPNVDINSAKKGIALDNVEKSIKDAANVGATAQEIHKITAKVFPASDNVAER